MGLLKYIILFLYILCLNFWSVLNISSFDDKENTFLFTSQSYPKSESDILHRVVRSTNSNNNISLTVNPLNDTHQQLIVHWVGEGSSIIICLARDPKEIFSRYFVPKKSSVYYSYDYGETYEDKSNFFKVGDNKTIIQLDKFCIHPKFSSRTVFVDSTNKMLFITVDDGKTFTPRLLDFVPSDVSFLSNSHRIFLVHDRSNSSRNLWVTYDFGNTWQLLQRSVRSFEWFSEFNNNRDELIIQREETDGSTSVFKMDVFGKIWRGWSLTSVNEVFVKGDYIFATVFNTENISSSQNNQSLHIKYKENKFIKATFGTNLTNKNFHIADITDHRIMLAVGHLNGLCNLYSSDIINEATDTIHFTLSLEKIFCNFPNIKWKETSTSGLSDTPFIDLHKVEGLRGIYIASQMISIIENFSSVSPEHLTTKITFNWGIDWRYLYLTNQGTDESCKLEAGCSLHLTQKFVLWYPTARWMPILSTKSAPGLIIATGTVGTSMKGHPSVYLSRDAGVTWKQVLKENYYFNIGDHGAIIVAIKFYKNKEEVDHILYSTDEGETWQSQKLTESPLKVYSLMTEPGENTTIFSLFGSSTGPHQWIIVKTDFQKAFSRNCTEDDYKFWSPYNPEEKKMNCLLGRKEIYKRRIPYTHCYNGLNFDHPIKMQSCVCDKNDFMCDDGFYWDNHTEHCIRSKVMNTEVDPYAVPSHCLPYMTYTRTKGYKKIPQDYCEGGAREYQMDILPCPIVKKNEFLLLAQKERIVTFNLNDPKPQILPIDGLQNVIAVEFDMQDNCLFFADIVSDVISKWCLSSGSLPKILVDNRLHSVEGMAYDWISKHLYFVDGVRSKIEVVRIDVENSNRFRKIIINSTIVRKPRGIAIHPVAGYMFWTDWVSGSPSVNRAHLDGSNPVKLFEEPIVEWPNGITVDYIAERIYWVDAREDYIGSSDLHGKRFRKIIEHNPKVSHPFSVAVYKDNMYWDDWKSNAIFSADKDTGLGIEKISNSLPGLMDLKIYAHSIQEGSNACTNNTYCSHLCFGLPEGKYSCQCPDDLILVGNKCMCPGNNEPLTNGTCLSVQNTCSSDYFRCKNGVCIPSVLKCDGEYDCGDASDEICDNMTNTCASNFFRCGNGKCIPAYWKCDHDFDCPDHSDEKGCQYQTCKAGQFSCDNGRCIAMKWHCDGENDCRDGSDERNCTTPNIRRPCLSDEFSCGGKPECIPLKWQCDNEHDCSDGRDEINCTGRTCESWQFQCANKKCIFLTWKCDGDNDCGDDDMSDEQNCSHINPTKLIPDSPLVPTNACMSWMFQCNNKKCIPYWWKCDGINDCTDNSDEIGCPYDDTEVNSTHNSTQKNPKIPKSCEESEFRCNKGNCIMDSAICDGEVDCDDGEDEKNCDGILNKCKEKSRFLCRKYGICIPISQVCDGIEHCPDGSDESLCDPDLDPTVPVTCPYGYFICDFSTCHPLHMKCDGRPNCFDETDELRCISPSNKTYQVVMLKADKSSMDSVMVTWSVMPTINDSFLFLPSIALNNSWKNASWTALPYYTFKNLSAFTIYNVTVYVHDINTKITYPPAYYLKVITAKGIPSPPLNVSVKIINNTFIEVKWNHPVSPNGNLVKYTVSVTPPYPPLIKSVNGSLESAILNYDFEEKKYFVTVFASNGIFESHGSSVVLSFKKLEESIVTDLQLEKSSDYSVTLSWKSTLKSAVFKVYCRVKSSYPFIQPKLTSDTSFTFTGLSPGVSYVFEVSSLNNSDTNDVATISASTIGSPFPSVFNISGKLNENTAYIKWDAEKNAKKNWQYVVYYGTNMQELFNGHREITENTYITIINLRWCTSYVFDVGVMLKESYGPLNENPLSLMTEMDRKAPPKDLRVSLFGSSDYSRIHIKIKWKSSCMIITAPIEYLINIREINTKESYQIAVEKTTQNSYTEIFNGTYDSHYNISVISTENGAFSSEWIDIKTDPVPRPYQLIALADYNRGFLITWETDKNNIVLQNLTNGFEVAVCECPHFNEKYTKIYVSKNSPLLITDLKENKIYSFAVRIITKDGHKSEFSEPFVMNMLRSPSEETYDKNESRNYTWYVLIVAFFISGAIGFLYWKRKKSRINFKNLANSHYNTRSGSTTFSGVNGLDMEDTSEIREHFSDDEPLVIA